MCEDLILFALSCSKRSVTFLATLFCAVATTVASLFAQEARTTVPSRLDSSVDSLSVIQRAIRQSRQESGWLVVIDKSDGKLSLYRSGEIDTTFSAEFGRGRSGGDKVKEGDWRTPEGEFLICYRNSNSRFYKALLLNYPLTEDAERGLRDGIIERSDYRRIMAAHEAGEIPDQYTGLGGLIEIHGRGGVGFDWTRGCIAISNSGIDYLFKHTRIGTKVVITE